MIIQISDNDSLIIRCHTFDNMPKMHDFCISIQNNHLYITRNAGEKMKIHLGEHRKRYIPSRLDDEGEKNFIKLAKSKPLEKGVIFIKLEKEDPKMKEAWDKIKPKKVE